MYELRTIGLRGVLRIARHALAHSQVALALVIFALLGQQLSHASFPATPTTGTKFWQGNAQQFSSLMAACQSFVGNAHPSTGNTIVGVNFVNDSNDKCVWDMAPGSFNGLVQDYQLVTGTTGNGFTCPSGATANGGECTCTPPLVQNAANNGCEASSVCVAGPAGFHKGAVAGEKVNPFNSCVNGCVTLVAPRLDLGVTYVAGPPESTYATFQLVRTANSCNGDNGSYPTLPAEGATPTEPSPTPECPAGQRRSYLANGTPTCQPIPVDRFCPTGYTYGTVNGKDTCISQGTSPPTASSPTAADKGETTESKETSTTVTNPDGSTTTTTKTNDGKGGGSETVTTKSADGKTVETVTKKTGDDGTCKPGTVGCMKSGTPSDGTLPKADVQVGILAPGNMSGFAIGNSCPPPLTFAMFGGTHSISFSMLCDHAAWIKPIVMLLASLTALFIVYGAITGKTN